MAPHVHPASRPFAWLTRRTTIFAGVVALILAAGVAVLTLRPDWLRRGAASDAEAAVETVVPVHTAKVHRISLHRTIEGNGTIAPEPARDGRPAASSKLASPVQGVLAEVRCSEGQHVEEGAILFQLDERAAIAEQRRAEAASVAAAAAAKRSESLLAFQQSELDRTAKLSAAGIVSDKDLHQQELAVATAKSDIAEATAKSAEAARALSAAATARGLLAVRAPISGTVLRIFANAGESVDTNPSTVLAELVDLDRLIVASALPAANAPLLKIGEGVEIFASDPSRSSGDKADSSAPSAHGSLAFIGLDIDVKTDTIPIRVAFPPDKALRPGQYVRVRVVVDERADALAVPVSAVVRDSDGHDVVAIVEGDTAVQRAVTRGIRDGELIEIQGDGITENATVVTEGAYGLPKRTKVRLVSEAP